MKRSVAFAALWTASAASAVGLGFLAVSFVDAEASPGTRPIAATESVTGAPVTAVPATSAPATSDDPGATTTAQPPAPAPAPGEYATTGGTVLASCDGGVLQVGAAPAAGWWLDDQDQHGEVEFESATREVEVHVACVDGAPAFTEEGVRSDSDADDSAGRVGGGHGSDDPPGDDRGGDREDG